MDGTPLLHHSSTPARLIQKYVTIESILHCETMKKQSDLLFRSPTNQLDTSESSTEPTNALPKSKQYDHGAPANQLIVEFPASRLDAIDSDSSEEITKSIQKVKFSPTRSVVSIDTHDGAWYSDRAKSYFEQRLKFHARDMYNQFGKRPNDKLLESPALALRYLGMEPAIFQGMLQCVRGQRKDHITRVVQQQHTCSSDQLCELSEQSSESARARATELGKAYARLQLD